MDEDSVGVSFGGGVSKSLINQINSKVDRTEYEMDMKQKSTKRDQEMTLRLIEILHK